MSIDWQSVRATPTADLIRQRRIGPDSGTGILWSSDPADVCELSALGVLAWEGRADRPIGSRYDWVGFNLLCNAAPTPFVLDGEHFFSVDSFYEGLKLPEGSAERAACVAAPSVEARRLARRFREAAFQYRGQRIAVSSAEHEGLVAAAIAAKVAQNVEVQSALGESGTARLTFPLSFSQQPGVLARVTPLALMIERWKLPGFKAG